MDAEFIRDLFAEFGPVQVRRMFGGAGLFRDGLMLGLVADDVIYLKSDTDGAAAFEQEGCAPFSYAAKGGRRTIMSYWRLPERLYDDPAELARWALRALTVARQSHKTVKKQRTKKKAKKAVSAAL